MTGKRTIIFGAARTGRRILELMAAGLAYEDCEAVCFADDAPGKAGTEFCGLPVKTLGDALAGGYDKVIVGALAGPHDMPQQLARRGVPAEKIDTFYSDLAVRARVLFLARFAEEAAARGLKGAAAELGVFTGDFARVINGRFPDRRLYLFDTFEGFDRRDVAAEGGPVAQRFTDTSVERVLARMPHPERCVVRKGYFPETAAGLDEKFCFVSLDADLYKPMLEGLRYFYPRLEPGGALVVHDYFCDTFPNVRKAVDDFGRELGRPLALLPLGDDISVAVLR